MATNLAKKLLNRALRKSRVRSKVHGTAVRPRLSVTISNIHISAQLIDDEAQHTLASATTVGTKMTGTMVEKCAVIGADLAKKAKKIKVTAVVFDRNGRQYAGRLKALADAARKEGLEF
ncbi:MAG: 50S ribosomal protein L18 [Candidatus Saccharimonas sp.]